jgi:hypothetical protein
MNKYLLVILMTLGLTSCSTKDEHYYLTHPAALQEAVKACPNKQPEGLGCDQIEQIAKRVRELAYQLQSSPQSFGAKILALQETIANQQNKLKKNSSDEKLKASLQKNQRDLTDYLAVVKWLESPES